MPGSLIQKLFIRLVSQKRMGAKDGFWSGVLAGTLIQERSSPACTQVTHTAGGVTAVTRATSSQLSRSGYLPTVLYSLKALFSFPANYTMEN